MGDSEYTKVTNLFCSDVQKIVNSVESINESSSNSSISECFTKEKTKIRPT